MLVFKKQNFQINITRGNVINLDLPEFTGKGIDYNVEFKVLINGKIQDTGITITAYKTGDEKHTLNTDFESLNLAIDMFNDLGYELSMFDDIEDKIINFIFSDIDNVFIYSGNPINIYGKTQSCKTKLSKLLKSVGIKTIDEFDYSDFIAKGIQIVFSESPIEGLEGFELKN